MDALVILNPYANRWHARRKIGRVERALATAGVRFDLRLTTKAGDAETLAFEAARAGHRPIIAAGGDGTVSEVVNGLLRAADGAATTPLGVLPIGTGNDFADMAGVPRDLLRAARAIASGATRQLDAARVNDRYFGNNCALAMEPLVTIENTRIRRVSGNLRYLLSLARALRKLTAWHMRIRWDDGEHVGPVFLLSVCNGPRCGGLFRMAPDARMDDGLLDFVLAPQMPKRRVVALLWGLLRARHTRHPLVRVGRTRRLLVESEPGTPLHADGEVLTESARRVEYEVLPGRITLLAAGLGAARADA